MNMQNLIKQLSMSQHPEQMAMNLLPNQNLKTLFSSLMNSKGDEEKAQRLADICNSHGITKEQLEKAYHNYR